MTPVPKQKSDKSIAQQCKQEVKFYIKYKQIKKTEEKNIYVCKKHKALLEKKLKKK